MEDFQVPALGSPGLDAYTVCSWSALTVCRGGNRQAQSSRLCTGSLQWPKTALPGQLIPGPAGAGASRASLPSGHDPYRASGKEEGTGGRQKLDRATPD